MHDCAQLNDLAREEIESLARDGIVCTPAEIVELNALGWSVESPQTRMALARGRPVKLGGEWLWPFTIQGIYWMIRNGFPLDRITTAMAYAMAHAYSEGAELESEGAEAARAVRQWYRKLRVTPGQVEAAIKIIDRQDAGAELPSDPDGKTMSLGDYSAFLSAVAGATPDFWERRCSMSYTRSVLTIITVQNHAENKPCANDPRIVAERALGWAIDKIRARHTTEVAARE